MTLPSGANGSISLVLDERAATRSGTLRFAGATHPGLMRERNEDRLHIDAERGLLVVVDGMGGAAAGEVAAETALAQLVERLERPTGTPEDRVREAIVSANNHIARLGRQNPAWEGMGCVLTLALVENGVVTVGHVGDSRLYRLRDGTLEKVTHDHSPIGMREDLGELSEDDAMHHPRRNEVYRAVGAQLHGPRDEEFIELLRFPLTREDAILLCSDGLTDLVPSSEIERVAADHANDERTLVQTLIDSANAAGGKDNVTVAFAAGDRFAQNFVRARRRRLAEVGDAARAQRASSKGFWGRRSTFFVLGALVGLGAYAAFQLLEPRTRPAALGTVDAGQPPAQARHEVGPGRAFHTITDALAAARAGDTIAVHPGRYREQVRLEDGVTLLAVSPGRAIIEPPPPADGASPVAALVAEGIGAGRVTGLVIAGGAEAPIDYGIVVRRSTVSIENVEVRGAKVAGVSLEDAPGSALIASWVHDNPGAGIVVRGAKPLLVQNRESGNGRDGVVDSPPRPGGRR